jgi:choice-of-anchor C domain-containing protein
MALASMIALTPAARANDIANGSVENGSDPGPSLMALSSGSNAITSWTVSRGDVRYIAGYWSAEDGGRSVALNGTTAGGIAQTFATQPNAVYLVSFYLSGDPFTTPAIKHVRVAAAGASSDFSFDVTPAWDWSMGWTLETWTFTATSSSTTLELYSLDDGSSGPAIDNVTVTLQSSLSVGSGTDFALDPIVPNPAAHGHARFGYFVPRTAPLRLSLFDLTGREVAVVADGIHDPGPYHRDWTAKGIEPGLYFVRLWTPGRVIRSRIAVAP